MNEWLRKTARRLARRLIVRFKRWWRLEGVPIKGRRAAPGQDPLLAVQIQPVRSYIALGIISAALCVLVLRAFWLQGGISTDFLLRQGEVRFARTLSVPAPRGQILDRNGIVLASTMPARSVWVVPSEAAAATPEQIAKLGKLLDMKPSEIMARIAVRRSKSFVYLHRQVDVSVANQVKECRIPGVHVSDEMRRQYPDGQVSAHVVGYTNLEEKGQEGIELARDKVLTGESGRRRVIRDRLGRVVEDAWLREPVSGKDIELSIDSRIQYLTFDALSKSVAAHKAKAGAAIVADVRTGEILALANIPTYDPNERRTVTFERMRNRALTDVFEPGSTMKPFAVAKGLDMGVVTPDTIIDTSPGRFTIGNRTISDTHNYGRISVRQVIAKSSNIGTTKISFKVNREVMYKMYRDLGFGTAPDVGFPGAAAGILRNGRNWQPIEQATISYGHGVAVSLVQLVRAYTAFARNGDVIPLTLFKTGRAAEGVQVYKPKTAHQMRGMMMGVLESGGTATRARVPGYSVAGKTGTAYKILNGQYVHRYVSDFIGIVPASNPRVIIAVMIDDPTEGGHVGGVVAGPVFAQIAEGVLTTLHVAPDQPDTLQGVVFAKNADSGRGVELAGGRRPRQGGAAPSAR